MKSIYFITLTTLLFVSCESSQENYIPNVLVNKKIDLSLPEFSDLDVLGGSIFIDGGNSGIIIYRYSVNEYKIYDRTCSYEPSLNCSFIDSINTTIAYCNCCPSAFLLDQNGASINAPALLPLRMYNWYLEQNELYIFN